jgi:hypothetical protein
VILAISPRLLNLWLLIERPAQQPGMASVRDWNGLEAEVFGAGKQLLVEGDIHELLTSALCHGASIRCISGIDNVVIFEMHHNQNEETGALSVALKVQRTEFPEGLLRCERYPSKTPAMNLFDHVDRHSWLDLVSESHDLTAKSERR